MIIRSKYTFKQFEKVFRAIAHKAAIEAVTKLESSMTINTGYDYQTPGKGTLTEVSTKSYYFKFDLEIWFQDKLKDINFTVEEKLYKNTNHSTKINAYSADDGSIIEAYIKELMDGIKIQPRFSLKECQKP